MHCWLLHPAGSNYLYIRMDTGLTTFSALLVVASCWRALKPSSGVPPLHIPAYWAMLLHIPRKKANVSRSTMTDVSTTEKPDVSLGHGIPHPPPPSQTYLQTQTSKKATKLIGRLMIRQTQTNRERETDTKIEKHTGWLTQTLIGTYTDRQTCRLADRQTITLTDRQTDSQTDR